MQANVIVIVGAGPSGLACAKYALDFGLVPFVLEKETEVGGVWNPKSGLTWNSMRTNLSKYSCCFKDFPWEEEADMFPHTRAMHNYFVRYAKHFNLYQHIHFNCEVTEIDFAGHNERGTLFRIKWKQQGITKETVTEKLIIANGMYDKPYIPQMPGIDDFKGEVIHSFNYKEGANYKGKKVLVIGGSFTGIQLSADLSQHTEKVFHSFRKPFFLVSHFLKINKQETLPIDMVLLKWMNIMGESVDKNIQARIKKNKHFMRLCTSQQDIDGLKITETDMKTNLYFTISTLYQQNARNRNIIPKKGVIKIIKQHSVVFDDGTQQQIDCVILATGYLTHLNFLSQSIKKQIQYDVNEQRQPFILYQQMFHPNFMNMIFVGVNKGVLIQAVQLEARVAISVLAGKAELPSRKQMEKQMMYQREYRTLVDKPLWPHDNYVKYGCEIAKLMDPTFDFDRLKEQNPQKYAQLLTLPVLQQKNSWTFKDIDQQIETLKNIVKRAITVNPKWPTQSD